ncbi:hypothetical protein HaLaN_32792 [Haematococcus lacustris]|uniref:Uncharacterized protein n=1 Tax=Haematococcus lacustris TaxID=44745 RepID=A0A6A0AME7_HAELA|nr:hypothetical protein HaLaN_32792 [Haematococcus lacustris]
MIDWTNSSRRSGRRSRSGQTPATLQGLEYGAWAAAAGAAPLPGAWRFEPATARAPPRRPHQWVAAGGQDTGHPHCPDARI